MPTTRAHPKITERRAFGFRAIGLGLLLGAVLCGACGDQRGSAADGAPAAGAPPSAAPSAWPRPSANGAGSSSPSVDAGRAEEEMRKLVAFGPRPAGSAALKKASQYLEADLKSFGLGVSEDKFNGDTPHGKIPMTNIIAELPGRRPGIVMITGHYDTAPLKDFVGANDGASSAAAVLEMARASAATTPEYTIWFVLFDGEEAVIDWDANNGMDNTYGSRHLVSRMSGDGSLSKVKAMILVDMIGDKQLDIKRESNSTPWLMDAVWRGAAKTGGERYFLGNEESISDDHIPFQTAGIPCLDIIDFDFGPDNSYWHTPQDTLDKVSGQSVKIVCDAVLAALPDIFSHLDSGG